MDRLTYLKGERSLSRKELKKYLIMFREDIEQESGIHIPSKEKIKNFTSEEFDSWFAPVAPKFLSGNIEDLFLIELIEWYICSINNVASAEATRTNDMYY